MKTGTLLILSFLMGIIGVLIGAALKLMHWANSEPWLIVGVITWLVFIVTAIYEVRTSKNISSTEKTMWTVGFVLMAGVTALIYLLAGRRKVIHTSAE